MRLLVDNQLPLQLANHLRKLGHECEHVLDVGLDDADDATVWSYAARHGSVLISKDEDFIFLANRPGETGRLIWVRLGNCRNVALLAAIDQVHDDLMAALASGQRIVEIR